MRVTRFPSRAEGLADRMTGFIAHLRMNGLKVGPQETAGALRALQSVEAADPVQARQALCAVLVPDADTWHRFDDLFDAYWFNAGLQRQENRRADHIRVQSVRPMLWQQHLDSGAVPDGQGGETGERMPDHGEGEAEGSTGRLIATRTSNLSRRDLRELMDDDSLRQAEALARNLAQAIRHRRSRRRNRAAKGSQPDMRRLMRASIARGGDPADLPFRNRPQRPVRLVVLCDVSGSMTVYARVFLAFLKGLVAGDRKTETYLFHTRLMRVTDALRDQDGLRAAARLSLMAEGFGGGTDISGALKQLMDNHGRRALSGRTVVMILSDGYCTSAPGQLAAQLARIRRRAGRIIWLNPLLGWRDYEPVAAAMQAALPHLDAHLPANTLQALAALEPEFARL